MCNVILWNNNLNLRVTIQGHCGSQCCVDVSYKISTSKEDAASTQDKNKRTVPAFVSMCYEYFKSDCHALLYNLFLQRIVN